MPCVEDEWSTLWCLKTSLNIGSNNTFTNFIQSDVAATRSESSFTYTQVKQKQFLSTAVGWEHNFRRRLEIAI